MVFPSYIVYIFFTKDYKKVRLLGIIKLSRLLFFKSFIRSISLLIMLFRRLCLGSGCLLRILVWCCRKWTGSSRVGIFCVFSWKSLETRNLCMWCCRNMDISQDSLLGFHICCSKCLCLFDSSKSFRLFYAYSCHIISYKE